MYFFIAPQSLHIYVKKSSFVWCAFIIALQTRHFWKDLVSLLNIDYGLVHSFMPVKLKYIPLNFLMKPFVWFRTNTQAFIGQHSLWLAVSFLMPLRIWLQMFKVGHGLHYNLWNGCKGLQIYVWKHLLGDQIYCLQDISKKISFYPIFTFEIPYIGVSSMCTWGWGGSYSFKISQCFFLKHVIFPGCICFPDLRNLKVEHVGWEKWAFRQCVIFFSRNLRREFFYI